MRSRVLKCCGFHPMRVFVRFISASRIMDFMELLRAVIVARYLAGIITRNSNEDVG